MVNNRNRYTYPLDKPLDKLILQTTGSPGDRSPWRSNGLRLSPGGAAGPELQSGLRQAPYEGGAGLGPWGLLKGKKCGGFQKGGYPHSWMVFVRENPYLKYG